MSLHQKIPQTKTLWVMEIVVVIALLLFTHNAFAVVRYPSVASLGVGDIKSTHIKDGEIVNADINANALISSSKITFRKYTGTASTTWALVMDYLASIATTSGNFIYSNGAGWVGCSGEACRYLMGLGTMSTQMSTSVSITGGTVTTTSPILTGSGGTGKNWGNATQGGVPYVNATGTITMLSPGTAGQSLTTAGPFADPYWTTPGAIVKGSFSAASSSPAFVNDTEKSVTSDADTLLKRITLGQNLSSFTLSFSLKSGTQGQATYCGIGKNGVKSQTIYSYTSNNYYNATSSVDLTGYVSGDTVEVWGWASGAGITAYCKNMRIMGQQPIDTISGITMVSTVYVEPDAISATITDP